MRRVDWVNRNRKVLVLVSIIAAVTIFSAYIVSGMLNRPLTIAKTTTLTTATWEIDRPRVGFQFINADEIGDTFKDNDLTIHATAIPDRYAENAIGNPFYGSGGLLMSLDLEATSKTSHLESFNYTFHINDENSSIITGFGEDYNCTVENSVDFGTVEQDANILFAVNGTSCSESRQVTWVFYDSNSVEHALNMSVECIYRSGSVDKKVIFPIVFSVILDAGNDFSTAEKISFGMYNRTIDNVDFCDFFALGLNDSERISVSIRPSYDTSLAYTLFDPNRVSVQHGEFNSTSVFIYDVSATGTWYIEVQQVLVQGHINEGQYSIAMTER